MLLYLLDRMTMEVTLVILSALMAVFCLLKVIELRKSSRVVQTMLMGYYLAFLLAWLFVAGIWLVQVFF